MLTEAGGRIFVILAGQPLCREPDEWQRVTDGASAALAKFRDDGDRAGLFKAADRGHRRGRFLAVASGVSFGGGQKVTRTPPNAAHRLAYFRQAPGNFVHPKPLRELLKKLLGSKEVQRIAGFQSSERSPAPPARPY